ncbi:glycosyltransferase domain-containing protein [Pantoea sp.]|uniref:glycosyltransferase domain-containing protein n=1 Tax=Pantoea sp. TaxID=69393 RepID=UPI002897B17F|nr:glycosyltransferase domain-containing protein [Pantoea sp.]
MVSYFNSSCIYTGVFGGYETLNELEGEAKNSKIRKICFTDDKELTSETWEIKLIKPPFPLDSVRSQRIVKVLPHKFLKEFKSSVYIDNTVKLLVDPAVLIKNIVRKPIFQCRFILIVTAYMKSFLKSLRPDWMIRQGYLNS